MSKIYPSENRYQPKLREPAITGSPSVLTVWKKSSMTFQGTDGFTVFDSKGRLVFRVDNYSRRNRCLTGGLVLMDGTGKALLTLRPKILSAHGRWEGFEGDDNPERKQRTPMFSLRRHSMVQSNDQAEVFMGNSNFPAPDFHINGCFGKRSCKIRQASGEVVAEISRKQVKSEVLLGKDVFSLIIQPGYDCELIMAFIIIMDRICRKPFVPMLCSTNQ